MRMFFRHKFLWAAGVVALTAFTVYSQTTPQWTLDYCVSEALKNSPRLSVSRRTADAASAQAQSSGANRYPTLGVGGAYSYTSKTQEVKIALPPIPGLVSPQLKFGDGNVYDFSATARVPLFAGWAVQEKSRADASAYQAALKDVASDSAKLVYDVRRAYFNALGAAARSQTAQDAASRLSRHLAEIEHAKAAGTASEESRISALSRLSQAEQNVMMIDAALNSARLTLGNLIGVAGQEVIPEGDLSGALVDSTSPPEIPSESRVEVAAVNARLEQTHHLTQASKGALLPTLSGNAAYHYAKPGVDMIKNDWMNYYVLGVTASWTLWDWNSRQYQVNQVRSTGKALEARKQDLVNSLNTARHTTLEVWMAARGARDKAAEHAALEKQRITMVENRLKNGMATESEYLDAQDDLTNAETDLATATVQLRLAEADLLYASGY
jgi:outer membrane protein TolC